MSTSTPLPFTTQDGALAFCLENAGIQMWRPPTNTYTADILFTAGGGRKDAQGNILRRSKYADMNIWDAAHAAWKEGVRGLVQYWFYKTPENANLLEQFLRIYTEQEAEFKTEGNDRDAGERVREIMARATGRDPETYGAPMDEREAIIRMFCIGLKGRVGYVNLWRSQVPLLQIGEKGKTRSAGNRHSVECNIKTIPLDASEQIRKDLKV